MNTAEKFNELSVKKRKFLSELKDEEIDTISDGIRLVIAVKTVGTFVKWVIIGILGIVTGFVMFAESIVKILAWFKLNH